MPDQMSYQVSNQEKDLAKKSIDVFNATIITLSKAEVYLSEIKSPFEKDPNISSDKIWEYRAAFWKFRDEFVKKVDFFKKACFICIKVTRPFSFDTQVINLLSSFSNTVEEFDKAVRDFVDLFKDLKTKEFGTELIKIIGKLEENASKIKDLISERVIPHIEKNILATTWTDDVGAKIRSTIGDRKRPIVDIEKSRG